MDTLRSQVIRLAHQKPELRPLLLPLLKEARVTLPAETIDGVKYKWVQSKKRTGRSAIGSAPQQLRSWRLEAPDGTLIAQLLHTHDVEAYVTPSEPPAWRVHIRVSNKDLNLKGRFPDPDLKGDENTAALQSAAKLAVQGYTKFKNAP